MTKTPTLVYVVETGMYDSQCIAGVYSTLEAAKAAYPDDAGNWREYDNGWSNKRDGDAHVWIERYEVRQ